MEILSDQHSIWIIYPRPNGACIAQRSCFDSLLQGRGHFSRKKADGFDYQIIGALEPYQISFRVVSVKDQIVARTTTRLKVNRARNSKISTVPKSKSSRRCRRWSKRRAMNNSLPALRSILNRRKSTRCGSKLILLQQQGVAAENAPRKLAVGELLDLVEKSDADAACISVVLTFDSHPSALSLCETTGVTLN